MAQRLAAIGWQPFGIERHKSAREVGLDAPVQPAQGVAAPFSYIYSDSSRDESRLAGLASTQNVSLWCWAVGRVGYLGHPPYSYRGVAHPMTFLSFVRKLVEKVG